MITLQVGREGRGGVEGRGREGRGGGERVGGEGWRGEGGGKGVEGVDTMSTYSHQRNWH